jgi:hypothetical protein
MRFGNSSNYFGLRGNVPDRMALNSATGKAFHAIAERMTSALASWVCARNFSQQCIAIGSKVTKDPLETAARSTST